MYSSQILATTTKQCIVLTQSFRYSVYSDVSDTHLHPQVNNKTTDVSDDVFNLFSLLSYRRASSLQLNTQLYVHDHTGPAQHSVWVRSAYQIIHLTKASTSLVRYHGLYTDLVQIYYIQEWISRTSRSETSFQVITANDFRYQ